MGGRVRAVPVEERRPVLHGEQQGYPDQLPNSTEIIN
jgi:hypothetical protein